MSGQIMLFYHFDVVCKSSLILIFLLFACTGYTYMVNLRRKADDPKKRTYHPFAILLAPVSVPLLLTFAAFVFILRALLFMGFLVIFTVLLVGLRKPFLFRWWHKFATKIGDPLLQIGTRLIKTAFSPWARDPQTI